MNTSFWLAIWLAFVQTASPDVRTLRGHAELDDHQKVTFKTNDGKTYPVTRTITGESLFVDKHVREMELDVSGRIDEKTGALDVIQIRSLHNGQLHDLYYWCETCRIRSTAPGPCWCCFQPFEFREDPIRK